MLIKEFIFYLLQSRSRIRLLRLLFLMSEFINSCRLESVLFTRYKPLIVSKLEITLI